MSDKGGLLGMGPNRDPKELNIDNEVIFVDVFGEPEHVRSLSCTWTNSKKIFLCTHQKCYTCLGTIFAFPLAFLWGIKYALNTFCMVWCCYPSFLSCRHCLLHVQKGYAMCIRCLLEPCYSSVGMVLSRINITIADKKSCSSKTCKCTEEDSEIPFPEV